MIQRLRLDPRAPRDWGLTATVAAATLSLAVGSWLWWRGSVDLGLDLGERDGIVVARVAPEGLAWRSGIRAGMKVVDVNGSDPEKEIPESEIQELTVAGGPLGQYGTGERGSLEASLRDSGSLLAISALLIGAGLWVSRVGAWWPGARAALLVVATFVALASARAAGTPPALAMFWFVPPIALIGFAATAVRLDQRSFAPLAWLALVGAIGASAVATMGAAAAWVVGNASAAEWVAPLRWLSLAALAILPGAAALVAQLAGPAFVFRSNESPMLLLDLALVSVAVLVAVGALWVATPADVMTIVGTAGALLLGIRTIARSALARFLTGVRERDLAIASAEAERSRLAAELHDSVLQELGSLIRHLDAAADRAGGKLARETAQHVRAVCGQLHHPVLDDLGAGPALEWLGAQSSDRGDVEIDLRVTQDARPPREVELAAFRIAQEAIANALHHGKPPIKVAYQSTALKVRLSVCDHGPGFDSALAARAAASGHFGLVNMRVRAAQVQGSLAIRPGPVGGTEVVFIWQA